MPPFEDDRQNRGSGWQFVLFVCEQVSLTTPGYMSNKAEDCNMVCGDSRRNLRATAGQNVSARHNGDDVECIQNLV